MVFKTVKRRVVEGLVLSVMAFFLINATITIPRRTPPPPATVAIIKDSNLDTAHLDTALINRMVAKAIDSALGPGGITNLVHSGNTVLIKPNLVTNAMKAVTDWRVVKALVNVIKTASPGRIIIAEASAGNNTFACMTAGGYTTSNFPGVDLLDLNDINANPLNTYVFTDGLTDSTEKAAAIIYDADVFITVPRMKTHGHCGFTGALKNIGVGTPPFSIWNRPGVNNKGGMHHDIRREIVDHVLCRVPDFALMDGIQAMEGNGPSSGPLVPMKLVVASKDPVAVDAVACNIIGIPPFLITHQVLCGNENIGTMDMSRISVKGNTIASVYLRDFVRAQASAPILTEPGSMPYRATTVIRPAPQAMTIDGDLSEWEYANAITANAAYQVNGNAANWSGPTDCSFIGKFLYDAQNLYVAVIVRDDHKQPNNATGAGIRSGECVELYLSTYPTQFNTSRGTTYNPQYDYCMGISYADNPQTWIFSHTTASMGVVASKAETSDGYIIEAQIPWSNFANSSLNASYRELGINLAVDDADNNATIVDNKILWANDTDIETNPIKMGIAYLDPAGGLYANSFILLLTSTNGTVAKSPNQMWYDSNAVVQLTAIPNAGYTFTGWNGDATGSTSPVSVTMDGNKNITANFTIKQYSITLASTNGTVSKSPDYTLYDSNTVVELTATPDIGFTFAGWGGDASGGTNPLSVRMNGNKNITANFSNSMIPQYSITLTSTNGTVAKSPNQTLYDSNSLVQLTATPNTGYTFTGWSGGATGSSNPVNVTMNGNKNITANFAIKQYSITLTSANGTVAKNPNLSLYDSNTVVALTATPNAVFTFSSWGGDASGTTNTASVTMNGNKNVIANFTIKQFSITVTSTNGTVAKNPNQSLYDSNTIVQLTATPNAGYTFTGWSGDTTGSTNPLSVTMKKNRNITANFSSTGLPSPWATQDIGSVSPAGSATWAADSFTVKGSGADIWGTADAFRFVSQSLSGDATIVARVASQTNSNGWAKSGIMFRETLTAGSKHVMLVVTPSNGVDLQYRATTGGSSTTVGAGTGITAPIWLRLVHSGSTFTAYRSTDGTNWTQAATLTQTMVSPLYTGLCVTSHANGTLCTSVFKNVSLTVAAPNNPPTIATPASATPNPVIASTTALSVLGADDKGEANLTYTWAATGTPPAAVIFSANGTNAAKNATATFTKAGSYNFQVTVKDQGNLTVTSSIAVTVNQTPTSIVVSPASATVGISATQQFTAAERDQFGTNLTTQPAFTWSVSGGGTISASGLFSAGTTLGGPYTVTAQSGSLSGTGSVTVSTSTPVYRINSGGSAASPFTADQYYSGGTASSTTSAITMTGVTNPAPQAVYQSERYGTFSYTLPGLVVGAQYTVRLHFAEIYWTASGKRTFNVVINGTTVLTNYDIFAAAGGQYRAVVREFTATADAQGRIVINFNTVVNNAKSSGIEIIRQ